MLRAIWKPLFHAPSPAPPLTLRIHTPQTEYDESLATLTSVTALEAKLQDQIASRQTKIAAAAALKKSKRDEALAKVEERVRAAREEEERVERNQREAVRIAEVNAKKKREEEEKVKASA